MAINPTPFATISCINSKTIRFYATDGDHVSCWVNYADCMAALDAYAYSTRLPGNTGMMYGGVPEDFVTRFVGTGGMVQAVPILQMTSIVQYASRIGPAQQALQASVLAALVAGQAAVP